MIFSLAIYTPPTASSSLSAFRFAEAVIEQGHSLNRIFFYHEGVHHGNALRQTPQDEFDLVEAWLSLKAQHQFELCICIAASSQRGIFTLEEAKRYDLTMESIKPQFLLVGLGDLIEASHDADRLITFGGS